MRLLFLFALLLTAVGCTSKTEFGSCIGVGEDEEPGLKYEYSKRNIIVGAIFFQTIAAPLVVVLTELKCPIKKLK